MSRAQQGAIESTETGNSATATTSATNSQQQEQQDINQNESQLAKFSASNPYVEGGAMQTDTNKELSNTADATASAAAAKNQQQAQRTGQNASAGVAAGEAEQEQAQRTLSGEEASATSARLGAGTQYGQDILGAGQGITAQQAALSSNLTGEAQGEENTAEQAAQTPSFLDELGQGLISGAGQVGSAAVTAFCPARGTFYLMADGTEKPVETLKVGELLAGIDGESQVIEEIQSAESSILRVETESGLVLLCSRVHAFALPLGGFAVAAHCMGKTIVTRDGRQRIVKVEPFGVDEVFNVITDGSHTYRADGLWSLGVGEAERQISMATWDRIGDSLVKVGG